MNETLVDPRVENGLQHGKLHLRLTRSPLCFRMIQSRSSAESELLIQNPNNPEMDLALGFKMKLTRNLWSIVLS